MKQRSSAYEGVSSADAPQLRRRATRILLATFVIFAPAPFVMLFIVGLAPLCCTAAILLSWVNNPGEHGQPLLIPAILAVHLIVDGGILYLVATVICRLLFGLCSTRFAIFAVGVLVTGEVIASFFPIYVVVSEHHTEFLPLWRLWNSS